MHPANNMLKFLDGDTQQSLGKLLIGIVVTTCSCMSEIGGLHLANGPA
jgi:hypothetical protein